MRKLGTLLTTICMTLAAVPAFAVDTTQVYSSGILVLIFLGICALFVVSQLIPAMVMLFGMIKGLFKGKKMETVAEPEKKNVS
jgi:hypothetical protein